MIELMYLRQFAEVLRARRTKAIADESGYSTEAVIVTALLAAVAIAVIGIIAVKITSKANDIQTG